MEHFTDLARLRAEYVFDYPAAVVDFLKAHQALPGLLDDAVESLQECFGVNPNLHLRVQTMMVLKRFVR